MTAVRSAAVAGTFYTDEPDRLTDEVDAFLGAARDASIVPRALVVPHAGYTYSGPVAGTAYACLRPVAGRVKRVVLLGPTHRVPVRGLAAPSAEGFATPLGVVPVDAEARELALAEVGVAINDDAHRDEHSIEVQLPFLQRVLGEITILPLAVGHTPAGMVADVIDALTTAETLVVVSTDLSHYESYESARLHDRTTVREILAGRIDRIGPDDACGCYPVRGLMEWVHRHGYSIRLVDLRNSGDTSGPTDRVVGYGAFVVTDT